MQKITKIYTKFYKLATKIIAKHYFKILNNKFRMRKYRFQRSNPTTVVKIGSMHQESISKLKNFQDY